jgi:drug/metabolite transporter (DMT)-like permease
MVDKTQSTITSKNRIFALIILVLTTILWGSTFILTKNIIQDIPTFYYLGIRFLLALIPFLPFLYRYKKLNKKVLLAGLLAGVIYYVSIAVQTVGLESTTAGKGGFITGLNTVIVPFLALLIFKKPINKRIWIAVGLSITGLALLLLEGESGLIIGDIFVLFCAFGFAFYIIYVDRDVKQVDIYLYLIIQIAVVALLSFITSIVLNESYDIFSADLPFWIVLIYMGVIASGLTFLFQNWGQKQVSPSQTAIIFTLEPVFAVLFASVFIGDEIMTIQGLIGGILILIAIIITVLKNEEIKKN